jgi:transcription factor C subunit 6
MRTRKSNQAKRFRPSDFSVDTDVSGGEEAILEEAKENSQDSDGFVDTQNHISGSDEDEGADYGEGGVDKLAEDNASRTARSKPATRRARPPPPQDTGRTRPPSEVQEYPTDPTAKWTRSYLGPVKRWTRLFQLTNYWFGGKPNYKATIDEFIKLWWPHHNLPPKIRSKQLLSLLQNPWMPKSFYQDQVRQFQTWYQRYHNAPGGQLSTPILRDQAFRWFLPQTDEHLTVLAGHAKRLEQISFRQGDSVPISSAGFPISDPDSPPQRAGGWLLDVGGIVTSLGWAPTNGTTDQLLAMTVVPFSDQAFYKNPSDVPRDPEKKTGSVQLWEFGSEKDRAGIPRPAHRTPTLLRAFCFSWGRASRMQWCPIPLTAHDHVGLLAILCGDGRVRVLEIMNASSSRKGTFGRSYFSMSFLILPDRKYRGDAKAYGYSRTPG